MADKIPVREINMSELVRRIDPKPSRYVEYPFSNGRKFTFYNTFDTTRQNS
jgi:hypothetical protein